MKWQDKDIQFLKDNLHLSNKELAEKLNTTIPSVIKCKQYHNLKKIKKSENKIIVAKKVSESIPKRTQVKIIILNFELRAKIHDVLSKINTHALDSMLSKLRWVENDLFVYNNEYCFFV